MEILDDSNTGFGISNGTSDELYTGKTENIYGKSKDDTM